MSVEEGRVGHVDKAASDGSPTRHKSTYRGGSRRGGRGRGWRRHGRSQQYGQEGVKEKGESQQDGTVEERGGSQSDGQGGMEEGMAQRDDCRSVRSQQGLRSGCARSRQGGWRRGGEQRRFGWKRGVVGLSVMVRRQVVSRAGPS